MPRHWRWYAGFALLSTGLTLSQLGQAQDRDRLEKLCRALGEEIEQSGRGPVVVAAFGGRNGIGSPLADLVGNEFFAALRRAAPAIRIVDRDNLPKLLEEQRLDATGLIDPDSHRRLGRMAGAKVQIVGMVLPLSKSIRVYVQALDVETAEVIAGDVAELPWTAELDQLVKPLARDRPREPLRTAESAEIRYELRSCGRLGSHVRCAVVLTSLKGNQTVRFLRDKTFLVDNLGGRYEASGFNTSTQKGWRFLPEGFPSEVQVDFTKVSPQASHIRTFGLGGTGLKAVFHKIPLEGP